MWLSSYVVGVCIAVSVAALSAAWRGPGPISDSGRDRGGAHDVRNYLEQLGALGPRLPSHPSNGQFDPCPYWLTMRCCIPVSSEH
ncbi:hypothetical protein GGS23DRAFT_551042 [Durotheca rogersii]|uniref:uncharacterized protein n=1 Tax=Durotheca rogersii TaxID=419775 RepID=UPI00221E45D4|nr:uncharacterized protein GGS23DRAFT_551042 [Durotheca rogersii]KAI5866538.1 hypothetical protein GGS23DRAFT_551042 [Durotheca rogersii]